MDDLRNELNAKKRKKDQQSYIPVRPPPAQQSNEYPNLAKLKQELKEELLREIRGVKVTQAQFTH